MLGKNNVEFNAGKWALIAWELNTITGHMSAVCDMTEVSAWECSLGKGIHACPHLCLNNNTLSCPVAAEPRKGTCCPIEKNPQRVSLQLRNETVALTGSSTEYFYNCGTLSKDKNHLKVFVISSVHLPFFSWVGITGHERGQSKVVLVTLNK